MRAGLALVALLSSGCNAILGNDSFRGPGDAPSGGDGSLPGDASSPDACSGIGCMVADCARQGKPPPSGGGRLVFSDVHFEHPIGFARTFPEECTGAPLTAQGKAIAFQLFDQPTCVP